MSCAYDVASDWREEPIEFLEVFSDIVKEESTPQLAQMAIDLFKKDIDRVLSDDGLERGIIAFKFVIMMMGVEKQFEEKIETEKLGLLLQIVDDILDHEEDTISGDWNCLNTEKKSEYIELLLSIMTDEKLKDLFPNSALLRSVVGKAKQKIVNMVD